LLYQFLFREPPKNKHQSLLRRQYWYPHNAIAQGPVIAGEPLIEKNCNSVIFGPEAVPLNRESVEHEYASITMVEAFCQDLIRVQSSDSAKREAIWKGSVEKDDVNRS
jgi:hypothetical protein